MRISDWSSDVCSSDLQGYWEKIQAVLRKHDVLLIADEVITGFARTGNLFGCESFGIKPDMMTLAKQLSGAYMPISAVLVSDAIYQAIADNSAKRGSFGRSEEHTSELQSLMRISYAVFCLKQKKQNNKT